MFFRDRAYRRGVEFGPYPLEALRHSSTYSPPPGAVLPSPPASQEHMLACVARRYAGLYMQSIQTEPAKTRSEPSEIPDDLSRRSKEIKGAAYYLDASHVGICKIPQPEDPQTLSYAITVWVEFGRKIESDSPAHSWVAGAEYDIALMRAIEIGASITGHIQALGYEAILHTHSNEFVNIADASVLGGIAQIKHGQAVSPFFADRFAAVAISTTYELACDTPLAPNARVSPLAYWWGINGSVSKRERNRVNARNSDQSRYAMEQVQRVERPTTEILDDEVPRVPKRAEFFTRARHGDLGNKAQQEVKRFATKHPLTDGMMKPLRALVPHQDGPVAAQPSLDLSDSKANSSAIRSLSYHLGADLTGICEIPDYAWYSHGPDGKPIEIKHKYAVVMLIDQGYDTMEGASGDDWISGCQSMRGYLRGAEIAGVMAEFLRNQGVSARAQTNADSEVLQIPLVLWAGLGELSRIGELVLNPFVGPRFKSVVLTTNLPLETDKPVDFGLQAFCEKCTKCARECPVNAIPYGDKVMFNGYEIWKPDVERCARYRITNPRGSACGRCMKTCPLNKVVTSDGAWLHRVGTWLGIHARWLKPWLVPLAIYLDDKIGYGKRNPIKRWWSDLEMVDGVAKIPHATNERDLNLQATAGGNKSPIGYYNACDNPPANAKTCVLVNHKAAVERASLLETVAEARQRQVLKREQTDTSPVLIPTHYIPIEPLDE